MPEVWPESPLLRPGVEVFLPVTLAVVLSESLPLVLLAALALLDEAGLSVVWEWACSEAEVCLCDEVVVPADEDDGVDWAVTEDDVGALEEGVE